MPHSMKRTAIAAGVLMLGLASSSWAQSSGGMHPAPNASTDANTNASISNHATESTKVSAADSTFMQHAAADNLAEVAMGKLALDKSSDAQVKQLAQKVIDDHTDAQTKLKTLAQDKQVKLPQQADADARKTAASMQKLDGSAFDKAWQRHMVTDHQKTIAMFNKAATSGDNEVSDFAQATLPALKTHLKMAEHLNGGKHDASTAKHGMSPPIIHPASTTSASMPPASPTRP